MHLQIAMLTSAIVGGVYAVAGLEMALKSLIVYLPLWGVCEFVNGVRVREAARCGACGFDPILYRQDRQKARAQVEARLGQLRDDTKAELVKRRESEQRGHGRSVTTPTPGPSASPALPIQQKATLPLAPAGERTGSTNRVVKVGDRNL